MGWMNRKTDVHRAHRQTPRQLSSTLTSSLRTAINSRSAHTRRLDPSTIPRCDQWRSEANVQAAHATQWAKREEGEYKGGEFNDIAATITHIRRPPRTYGDLTITTPLPHLLTSANVDIHVCPTKQKTSSANTHPSTAIPTPNRSTGADLASSPRGNS